MQHYLRTAVGAGVAVWLAFAAPVGAQGTAQGKAPGSVPTTAQGTAPSTAQRAPGTVTATGAATSGATVGGAMPMPHGIVPSRSELPMSAFNKLDSESKGYVTRDDVQQLDGFGNAFAQADQNRDGRLNASEFNSAWAIYTGNNP